MFGLGITELLVILLVLLLLFGANKLPQLGSGLGQGIRSFRKAFRELQDDEKEQGALEERQDKAKPPSPPEPK